MGIWATSGGHQRGFQRGLPLGLQP